MKTLREYIEILDEISRRDFLKGAGAAAGLAAVGGAGYVGGRVSVFEQKVAYALGYLEQFLSMDLPNEVTSNYSFKIQMRDYRWWSQRVDTDLRNTEEYKLGRALANSQVNQYTKDYIKTKEGADRLIGMFADHVSDLRGNAGYIAKDIKEEELDETSEDAVARILELSKNK